VRARMHISVCVHMDGYVYVRILMHVYILGYVKYGYLRYVYINIVCICMYRHTLNI